MLRESAASAHPKGVTITVSDEGYILMPNTLREMGKYLKYADLKFEDSAEGRGLMHNSNRHRYTDNERLCKPKVR